MKPGPSGTVASLWRFPVKSMQGEELAACEVDERGLAGDRAYGLLDPTTGRLCSAKHPRKWGALFGFRAVFVRPPEPGEGPPPVRITLPDGTQVTSDDPGVDAALSEALGREVRLVRTAPEGASFEEVWSDLKGGEPYGAELGSDDGERVTDVPASFAAPAGTLFDFSAIHLLTVQTLERLRRERPESSFEVRRFRPNIVVDAADASGFVENDWVRAIVRIGELRLKVIIPTPRCVMTTLPQEGLPHDRGVLRATAEHNRIRAGGLGELPCAGVYAAVEAPGTIRVGDGVRVEEDRAAGSVTRGR